MARVKEHAKRAVIILAVLGFIFSSVAITVLAVLQSNNEKKQQESLNDLQSQVDNSQCSPGPADDKKVDPAPAIPANPELGAVSELRTEDLSAGTGREVKEGDCILLFFHGILAKDGKAFNGGSNYDGGIPYRSQTTGFIPGFSKGLNGMKAGGERRIFIPAAEGYGATAQGDIPANSDLIFTVKVVEVVQNK
jgi:FKBP-type peptidyl-prolyl cis-trans isomerase